MLLLTLGNVSKRINTVVAIDTSDNRCLNVNTRRIQSSKPRLVVVGRRNSFNILITDQETVLLHTITGVIKSLRLYLGDHPTMQLIPVIVKGTKKPGLAGFRSFHVSETKTCNTPFHGSRVEKVILRLHILFHTYETRDAR